MSTRELDDEEMPVIHSDECIVITDIPEEADITLLCDNTISMGGRCWKPTTIANRRYTYDEVLAGKSLLRICGFTLEQHPNCIMKTSNDLTRDSFIPINQVEDCDGFRDVSDVAINEDGKIDLWLEAADEHDMVTLVRDIELADELSPSYIMCTCDNSFVILLSDGKILNIDVGYNESFRQSFANAKPIDLEIGLKSSREVTRMGSAVINIGDDEINIIFFIVGDEYFEFYQDFDMGELRLKKKVEGVLLVSNSIPVIAKPAVKGAMSRI